MQFHQLTFAHIMERHVLYYDADASDACAFICQRLNINALPSLDGETYYPFDEETKQFGEPLAVLEMGRAQSHDMLFTEAVRDQFAQAEPNVLFVYEGRVLVGVVHLSDFNRSSVLQIVQDDIILFERDLRRFFTLRGRSDADMLRFFEYQSAHAEAYGLRNFYTDNSARLPCPVGKTSAGCSTRSRHSSSAICSISPVPTCRGHYCDLIR